jgi:subtilisin
MSSNRPILVPCRRRSPAKSLFALLLAVSCDSVSSSGAQVEELPLARQEREVIVVLRQASSPVEHRALLSELSGSIRRRFTWLPGFTARLPAARIAELSRDPRVASVEESGPVEAIRATASAEESASWGISRIGADAAHARGILGTGVRVAILDTGIDYSHPELSAAYRGGYNFLADSPDPLDDSYGSHGTHVAGIIASALDQKGTAGVAPGASLYAVKVLDGGGFGDLGAIVAGIDWAIANRMDVVNMSFGTQEVSPALEDACNRAAAAGVVLVAAAGYRGIDAVSYPAAYPSVIGVGATDCSDAVAAFSPVGPAVGLVAPGSSILSTLRGGTYGTLSGTSQSAPHVAGAAALLLSAGIPDENGDGLRADEVRARLQSTAEDLGAVGRDDRYGFGLVDLSAALAFCEVHELELTRTAAPPGADAQRIALAASSYEIAVVNAGLLSIFIDVRGEGDPGREHRAVRRLELHGEKEVTFSLRLAESKEVTFVPEGYPSSWARLKVTPMGSPGCPPSSASPGEPEGE